MHPTSTKMASPVVSLTSRFFFQLSRYVFIPLFLYLHVSLFAQIKTTLVSKTEIPSSVVYKGNYLDAYKWNDTDGEHLLVRTETGETEPTGHPKEEGFFDAALYAYHFIVHKDSVQLIWKLQDFVKECQLDVTASFVKNSFIITDLDKNNHAEIWLTYKTTCRSDISPATLKIIMYEETRKFAVRGYTKIPIDDSKYDGGEMSFDDAFKNGPSMFKDFATKLWSKNVIETFE